MLLAHLSDLHLSRYGESGTWTQRDENSEPEVLQSWRRWQIEGLRDRKGRPSKLQLVDPEGVIHWSRSWPESSEEKEKKVIAALLARALERHRHSAEELVLQRPSEEDLRALLQVDPDNTNLRFVQLVGSLSALAPDLVIITGDLTDNGFGYQLVKHYLKPWIDRGRLLAIPGNHDTYDMFPRPGRKARIRAKEQRYQQFAAAVDVGPARSGAWFRRIEDLAVVGFSSCKPPRTILSASGEVAKEQLEWLKKLRHRPAFAGARLHLGLVHHHLLRMPLDYGKRSPFEVAMRLRNAREVMDACTEAGFDMIFNGHRHHGYLVKLPGRPTVVSSPSSTLGCKSSCRRYLWQVDLSARHPFAEPWPTVPPSSG